MKVLSQPSPPPPPIPSLFTKSIDLKSNLLRYSLSSNRSLHPSKHTLSQLKHLCDISNSNYSTYHRPTLKNKTVESILNTLQAKIQSQSQILRAIEKERDRDDVKGLSIVEILERGVVETQNQSLSGMREENLKARAYMKKMFSQSINMKQQIFQSSAPNPKFNYNSVVKSFILQSKGPGADAYQLSNQFYKLDKNPIWSLLSYQLSDSPTANSLHQIALTTLRLIESAYRQILPPHLTIQQINTYLKRQVLPLNKLPTIVNRNNLHTFAILYMLLKTGQFDRIDQLKLNQDITTAFIQFFKNCSLEFEVEIPPVEDVYLRDLEDMMEGRSGEMRLLEDNVDFAWRSLTMFGKHPEHPKGQLEEFQRRIAGQLKSASPSEYPILIIHLIYSLNYQHLVQLPNQILDIELRVHIAIVLYSIPLIPKSTFIKIIKQYLLINPSITTIVDYVLLLEQQQQIFQILSWCLFNNYKVCEFFGLYENRINNQSEYQRLAKYFEQQKFNKFVSYLIRQNPQTDLLTRAKLSCMITHNIDQSLLMLLSPQIFIASEFKSTINLIQQDPYITPTQKNILSFIKFYKESLELISSNQFNNLDKGYILMERRRLEDVVEFLFENEMREVFLNYVKVKILYLEKVGKRREEKIDVEGDYKYYEERVRKERVGRGEQQLSEEIRDYFC